MVTQEYKCFLMSVHHWDNFMTMIVQHTDTHSSLILDQNPLATNWNCLCCEAGCRCRLCCITLHYHQCFLDECPTQNFAENHSRACLSAFQTLYLYLCLLATWEWLQKSPKNIKSSEIQSQFDALFVNFISQSNSFRKQCKIMQVS